jgi:uncharacterized protein (DUF983 family)
MDTALSLELPQPRDLRTAMLRSLLGRCPNCGTGKLMKSYLKQVDACAHCGESFGQIRADDAPPWLTILIVGHVVIPFAMSIEAYALWPEWAAMVIWPVVAAAMSIALLPRAKALFIAIIWATRAPGFL